MITFIDEYGATVSLGIKSVVGVGIGYALVAIVFYLLRSFGLYKLATRHNIKKAKLAFVPCLWLYVACKLVSESRFFTKPFDKIAGLLTTIYTVAKVLVLVANILWYLPVVGYVLTEGSKSVITIPPADMMAVGDLYWTGQFYVGNNLTSLAYPYANVELMFKLLRVLDRVNALLELAVIFITVSVFFALFKKFWPQHYILAAILSTFSLFGILVFIIRKNKAVDWMEYSRSRYSYYTPFNPYQNDRREQPQSQQYRQPPQNRGDSPFSEFENKNNEEPFSEFNNKDK